MAKKKIEESTSKKKSNAANAGLTTAVSSGFDPKNRLVELIPTGKTFSVRKSDTSFEKTGLSKADALELFEQQISCSQN